MKVSIIIPTYNGAKYLPQAVESILAQTYDQYEIVIIDDGSTDQTKDIVSDFIDSYPGKIRYIYQDNAGVSVARNTGIQNSKGRYIAFLDSDDQWLSQHLEKSVMAIESQPSTGLVHSNLTRVTESGKTIETPVKNEKYVSGKIFEPLFLRKGNIACSTVLFKKECCEKVGYFDEQLTRLGCEDREMWLRIAQQYEIYYIDEVLVHYRVHETNFSRDHERMFKARCYVIDKFCSNGTNHRLRKLALARIYRDMGDEFLLLNNFDEAKKWYTKSIAFAPLTFWPWVNLFKSLLKMKV